MIQYREGVCLGFQNFSHRTTFEKVKDWTVWYIFFGMGQNSVDGKSKVQVSQRRC